MIYNEQSLCIWLFAETYLEGQIMKARQEMKQGEGKVEHPAPFSITDER